MHLQPLGIVSPKSVRSTTSNAYMNSAGSIGACPFESFASASFASLESEDDMIAALQTGITWTHPRFSTTVQHSGARSIYFACRRIFDYDFDAGESFFQDHSSIAGLCSVVRQYIRRDGSEQDIARSAVLRECLLAAAHICQFSSGAEGLVSAGLFSSLLLILKPDAGFPNDVIEQAARTLLAGVSSGPNARESLMKAGALTVALWFAPRQPDTHGRAVLMESVMELADDTNTRMPFLQMPGWELPLKEVLVSSSTPACIASTCKTIEVLGQSNSAVLRMIAVGMPESIVTVCVRAVNDGVVVACCDALTALGKRGPQAAQQLVGMMVGYKLLEVLSKAAPGGVASSVCRCLETLSEDVSFARHLFHSQGATAISHAIRGSISALMHASSLPQQPSRPHSRAGLLSRGVGGSRPGSPAVGADVTLNTPPPRGFQDGLTLSQAFEAPGNFETDAAIQSLNAATHAAGVVHLIATAWDVADVWVGQDAGDCDLSSSRSSQNLDGDKEFSNISGEGISSADSENLKMSPRETQNVKATSETSGLSEAAEESASADDAVYLGDDGHLNEQIDEVEVSQAENASGSDHVGDNESLKESWQGSMHSESNPGHDTQRSVLNDDDSVREGQHLNGEIGNSGVDFDDDEEDHLAGNDEFYVQEGTESAGKSENQEMRDEMEQVEGLMLRDDDDKSESRADGGLNPNHVPTLGLTRAKSRLDLEDDIKEYQLPPSEIASSDTLCTLSRSRLADAGIVTALASCLDAISNINDTPSGGAGQAAIQQLEESATMALASLGRSPRVCRLHLCTSSVMKPVFHTMRSSVSEISVHSCVVVTAFMCGACQWDDSRVASWLSTADATALMRWLPQLFGEPVPDISNIECMSEGVVWSDNWQNERTIPLSVVWWAARKAASKTLPVTWAGIVPTDAEARGKRIALGDFDSAVSAAGTPLSVLSTGAGAARLAQRMAERMRAEEASDAAGRAARLLQSLRAVQSVDWVARSAGMAAARDASLVGSFMHAAKQT